MASDSQFFNTLAKRRVRPGRSRSNVDPSSLGSQPVRPGQPNYGTARPQGAPPIFPGASGTQTPPIYGGAPVRPQAGMETARLPQASPSGVPQSAPPVRPQAGSVPAPQAPAPTGAARPQTYFPGGPVIPGQTLPGGGTMPQVGPGPGTPAPATGAANGVNPPQAPVRPQVGGAPPILPTAPSPVASSLAPDPVEEAKKKQAALNGGAVR